MTRRMFPYGDRAVLVELDNLDEVLALREGLEATRTPGVVDIVPAARTVTVTIDPAVLPIESARSWLVDARPLPAGELQYETVTIDVEYSGEDLGNVAQVLGVSADEVVRLHTKSVWRVAFCGFAPGFGYLVTDHDRLVVPRRESPRTSVPAGSVALAGEFSGVYPRSGPGGWQLIGTTDAALFDPARDPAALLRPGVHVRFRAVGAARANAGARASGAAVAEPTTVAELAVAEPAFAEPTIAEPAVAAPAFAEPAFAEPGPTPPVPNDSENRSAVPVGIEATRSHPASLPAMRILDPGQLALIEDLGRPGNAAVGAARSGALDRGAFRLGNRLVGNREDAAALELLVGGLTASIEQPLWFAVTGALCPITLDGQPIEPDEAVHALAGQTLRVGAAKRGLRAYIAVRGGIAAQPALGSRSRDVLAELGPAPLGAGDVIRLDSAPHAQIPAVDTMTVAAPTEDAVTIRVMPGPREDWFTAGALERFYGTQWTVTAQGNRTGIRLEAAGSSGSAVELERAIRVELPSEAMIAGAIQVPPSGQPTVLLADHPTTGGYPVIAVVTDASLDAFAQLRPGQRVAFRHAR
jgi:KipI family sensor histidine kinase inhibitor